MSNNDFQKELNDLLNEIDDNSVHGGDLDEILCEPDEEDSDEE